MLENNLTFLFGELPIWHLCTDGESQCLIFRDTDDMKQGMNITAVCACKFLSKVQLFTFTLMNNHMHFIIQGKEEDIDAFFTCLHRKVRRMLLRQNRVSDIPKPKYKLIAITSESQLQNELAYVNRNGYVVNPNVTQYSYEWGAIRYFFNTTQANEEKKPLSEMHKREKMKFFHTHDIDFPSNWYLTNGYISPLCYCKIAECEMLFRNGHHYSWLMTKNVESFKDIADKLGDKIFYTDEELYTAAVQFSHKNFKNIKINTLDKNEKIQTAKHLHFNFNATNRQIARTLKLPEQLVDELFPRTK